MAEQNQNNAGQPDAGTSDVTPAADVDVSTGFPIGTDEATTPPETPAGTPQPDAEPTKEPDGTTTPPETPEAPDATVERLKQQVARQNKLLGIAGIDPASDIGEQLENGLISTEDVQNHVRAKYQTPQTTNAPETSAPASNDPVALAVASVEAAQKGLVDAKAAVDSEIATDGSISVAANNALFNAQQASNDANNTLNSAKMDKLTQQITADKQFEQVNQSVEAVKSIARGGAEFANMAAPLQKTVEDVTLAYAGAMADKWAMENGINPATLTTAQYQHFANEASKQLESLSGHFTNLGRGQSKAGFVPNQPANPQPSNANVNTNIPVPANASGDPVPVNNPYINADVTNHEALARQYAKGNQAVV